jgi:hypothetical protein
MNDSTLKELNHRTNSKLKTQHATLACFGRHSPFSSKTEAIPRHPMLAIFDPSIFLAIRIPYSSKIFWLSQVKASSTKSSLVKHF